MSTVTPTASIAASAKNNTAPKGQILPGKALVDAGLTQICRDVLTKADRWVTVQEIREMLSRIGIDMSGYTNPGAVLHAILKRIASVREDSPRGRLYAINEFVPYDVDDFDWAGEIATEPEVDVETLSDKKTEG